MMIVLKNALVNQDALCSIGNINCHMAPSVNAFYIAQEGFPKVAFTLVVTLGFALVSAVSPKPDSD